MARFGQTLTLTSLFDNNDHICVGIITGSRGVRGEVTVKSFTENPQNIAAYGPVTDKTGRCFDIDIVSQKKGTIIVRLSGLIDKNSSDALKGTELYVSKSILPKNEKDEFFSSDLLGLSAETMTGEHIGFIRKILNFGAGDIIELSNGKMISFTLETVPMVDLKNMKIVVDLPLELLNTGGKNNDKENF